MRALSAILSVFWLLCVLGCGGVLEPTVVTSRDGVSRLSLPSDWMEAFELHQEAVIQAQSVWPGAFLIVLTDSKVDVVSDLAQHSELTRAGIGESVQPGTYAETGPTELVIGGMPALRYRLTGTIDGQPLVYQHTTVEGAGHWHQIIAWTSAELASRWEGDLEQIVAGFEETGEGESQAWLEGLRGDLKNREPAVLSEDGLFQVRPPGGWRGADLHDEAILELSNADDSAHFIALLEHRSELGAMTLEEHSRITRGFLRDADPAGYEESAPSRITIGPWPAVQVAVSYNTDHVRVTGLHTSVETPDSMVQLLAWTTRSRGDLYRPELEALVQSLSPASVRRLPTE